MSDVVPWLKRHLRSKSRLLSLLSPRRIVRASGYRHRNLCCKLAMRSFPAKWLAVVFRLTLSHDHRAHEDLNGPDALQRHLALTRCLVETKLVTQLLLGDGVGVVNLVAQDDKRHLLELLHGQQGIKLGLGLGETLVVLGIDEEDNTVDLGEVVLPKTAGYCEHLLVLPSFSSFCGD